MNEKDYLVIPPESDRVNLNDYEIQDIIDILNESEEDA